MFSSSKALHLPCITSVIRFLLVLICISLLFWHRFVLSPLLLLWKLPVNLYFDDQLNWTYFQIYFENISVLLFILTFLLMALNPSIQYSTSPGASQYGISYVVESLFHFLLQHSSYFILEMVSEYCCATAL